jgi:cellulose synthase operon protein C
MQSQPRFRGVRALLALGVLVASTATGCAGTQTGTVAHSALDGVRSDGRGSSDGDAVGRWALGEMFYPGGDPSELTRAEIRLASPQVSKTGMYGNLARAILSEAHGAPRAAADAYVATLRGASDAEGDPRAPLIGWYASHHLLGLRSSVTELYASHKDAFEALIAGPGNIGWRAAAEILEWSAAEAFDKALATGDAYDTLVMGRLGCAKAMQVAGPFGHGAVPDRRRSFPAEAPGPWPPSWPEDPIRGTVPHILHVEQHRCFASSTEATEDGIYYVQSFFSTGGDADLILAVQGSVKVWVDDVPVLERDLRQWGVWQRFGVALHVSAGRHRVLARVISDGSSIRLLTPEGHAADVDSDANDHLGYSAVPPRILGNPNVIDGLVTKLATGTSLEAPSPERIGNKHRGSSTPGPAKVTPLDEALAAFIAHVEGLDDVATVLSEPLVTPKDAAALALEEAAGFVGGDPALPEDVRKRTEKDLRTRAFAKDAKLWRSRAWLIIDDAEQRGLVEGVTPLRRLADEVSGQPEVLESLARVYKELEWRGERMRALANLASRFPDDVNALRLYLEALEQDGAASEADAIAARVRKLDPDSEVDLDRALARHDWPGAIKELQRLGKRRPDRKEIAARIAAVLEHAGDPGQAADELSKALAKNPLDSNARFRLADRAYAKGDTDSLRRALADALQRGAKVDELRGAIDLLEGATDLEPYRQDGRKVIREFEAWEKAGKHHMEGNAARVLDYAATWVHPDGSSEMLEHEILRIQSQEAIGEEAEQQKPSGLVLHLRVIKPDGSILEPEPVAGKPTESLPHLEVGDYVEMEHIAPTGGDGPRGKRYRGPHWFFREADKGYWRSEFVAITPKDRELEIETHGTVPKPTVRPFGTFVERRWRVDLSPPALEEPESPPITEFLPSVRIGWGISLDDTVRRLVDAASEETPLDPRLRRRALEIVGETPEANVDERARLVYKDLALHVEDGREGDGRRVMFGRSGSRQAAFQYMMRELGIPLSVAIVKNKLATPPVGQMSEVEDYDNLVLRLDLGKSPARWLTVRDKFAPYGYVPAELRGQPAIVLTDNAPKETTSLSGAVDGITFEGRATLRPDGSGSVDLVESFAGKIGISMRNVLDKIPDAQLHDFVEQRLLGRNLPGAKVSGLKVLHKTELGEPIVLNVAAEVPELARLRERGLLLTPLFSMHLAQLAALPERQTPLLLAASSHVEVRFEVVVPESIPLPASLPHEELRDTDRSVLVGDAIHGHAIELVRTIDIPAGRVQPGEDYERFRRFVEDADALLDREVPLGK